VYREVTPGDASGRTIIGETPEAFEPTVDFPAPPAVPLLPVTEAISFKTIIGEVADPAAGDALDRNLASPIPATHRNGASNPDAGVAKSLTDDVLPGSAPVVTPGDEQGASRKSSFGIRTTAPMSTESNVTEPPNLPGYKVVHELGRGGMGVVYRAYDEKLDRQVALKTLQRISPVGLQRFKQEFRALADVSHPNLAALYDLLSDGQTWCFTMEILEAVDFLEYVWSKFEKLNRDPLRKLIAEPPKAGPRLSLAILHRLYDGLKQLALGLHALHEAGVLHRDIKPSNILVTKDGRVVLVDFGLASEIDTEGRPRGIQGTAGYMAPEQAACQPMTPASDWYAVGVMLYELLTGRLPIEGTPVQIILKKQTETPQEPREWEPSVPPELNDLCVALLQRDPAKRPSVYDILSRIGADEVAETLRAKTGPRTGQVVELVGRERHLETLREAFDQVSNGSTRSVFVHGKSGMGKSVLIQTLLEEIKNQGDGQLTTSRSHTRQSVGDHAGAAAHVLANVATVLTGRCYEQESVPFKALDSLIDSLADYLSKLPADVARQAVPEDSLPLVRLFPVLGQMPGATDAGKPSIDNIDQPELRQRAMNALRELLKTLGTRQPLVLYIDDLQWGDVDSAVLLADLVRPPESPRMLVLGSYRSENVDNSLCLKALATAYTTGQSHPHRQELAVEALSEPDATRLALLLLNRDDLNSLAFAAKIARESGGWPFFVWELVQHVQEAPEIADQTLELDEVIWTRVGRLPDETRRLLELIAVAGRPLVVAEAYQALDVGATGQNLLVQLRTRNLIRTTGSEDESTIVETYHDRIRESVVNHLDDRTKRRYNQDLAETILQISGISAENLWAHLSGAIAFEEPTEFLRLERRQWQRVFELSHFYAAAGDHGKALPFAVIAAEQARQQNALEVAEQQYRIALQGSVTSSPPLRFRILEGLGDVLILRGRYDAANEQLQAARALAKENVTLARIDGKLGKSSFNKGDMGDAGVYLEKALTALNERPPGNLVSLMLRMSKEGVVQLLHTFFPSRFVGGKSKDSPQGRMDLFRARLFDDLTIVYWFSRSMELVLWSHLRQMNLAERYPATQEMGRTYAFHAITMTAIPLAQRGIDYATRAYQISVDAGDLWGQGKARSYHTFACIVLARFQEGLRTGAEAVRLLEQAGDVWEANMASMISTVPKYHLGDLKSVARESKKSYEIGLETGDYSAVCISLLFWIPAAPHQIPRGAIQKELDRKREDPLSIAAAVYARGLELLLCEDNPAEAAKVLQDCLDRAKKRGLRNVCIFSALSWKATALRIVAERTSEGPGRTRALSAARKACQAALKITKSYLACRPHALRETGIVAALEGHAEQARQSFVASLRVAEQYEARYDHAKTRLAQAEAGLTFGWPGSEEHAVEARAEIKELENVESH
jgi:serine/threonine protein kinase